MIYQFNNIQLDTDKFTLWVNGQEQPLEPQVFNLIVFLIENKDKIVSRDELLNNVWKDRVVSDTSINNSIKSARKILGDDGNKQQIIKTIRSRGYQFIAELKIINDDLQQNNKINKKNHMVPGLLLSFFALLVIGLTAFNLLQSTELKTEQQTSTTPSIAVLPFINSQPDVDSDYYGFAIADQVIGALNYLKNITVRPSSAIRVYASHEFNPIQAGADLGVDFILTGYYSISESDIRINTELVDMSSHQIVWRGKPIETSYKNTFRLQDMVVRQVLGGLKIEFATERLNNSQQNVPQSPLAYEYYLRSIAYPYNTEGHRLAVAMLEQSINLDDQYAPAYIQLGNRTRMLSQFGLIENETRPDTEGFYLKALSLNPELLDAMAHLSMLYTETNRIYEAMELALDMYQLNPNNANTQFTLGYIYRYAGLLDEAISAMEKAVSLDPKNIKFRSLIGTYSATGQYQKALDMTELYEPSPFTYGWQGLMHNQLGDSKKALEIYDYLINNHPNSLWSNVAIIHKSALLGNFETGIKAVDSLVNTQVVDGETIYYTAAYYALLGKKMRSIQLLEKAVENGYFNHLNMATNEYFDDIKATPEFQTILEKAENKHLAFKEKFFPEL